MEITHFCVKKFKEMKKIVKIVAFQGNTGNSDGDGVLNSNHRGTGREKNCRGPRGTGSFGFPWHPYSISNTETFWITISNSECVPEFSFQCH